MNNPKFDYYIDIYPKELEIKDTTDAPKWDNYLDLYLEFDEYGKLCTQLYDKRDDFDFPIVNVPCLAVIFQNPLHMVFLFHSWYVMLGFRGSILVSKLLKKGYYSWKLQTTFWKFYGRHTDLLHKFDTFVSHILNGLFTNCDIGLVSSYLE